MKHVFNNQRRAYRRSLDLFFFLLFISISFLPVHTHIHILLLDPVLFPFYSYLFILLLYVFYLTLPPVLFLVLTFSITNDPHNTSCRMHFTARERPQTCMKKRQVHKQIITIFLGIYIFVGHTELYNRCNKLRFNCMGNIFFFCTQTIVCNIFC